VKSFGALCRPPAVVEEEDAQPLGKPQVLADIDYAQVVGLSPTQPEYMPSWFDETLCADLRHSQVLCARSPCTLCFFFGELLQDPGVCVCVWKVYPTLAPVHSLYQRV
jgi:hypothetical protein